MTQKSTRQLLALLIVAAALAGSARAALADVAIVVSRDSQLHNLATRDLQRIFLGRITTCVGGDAIHLGECDQVSAEVYPRLLDMSLLSYRRVWIKSLFAGGRATPPEPLISSAAVREFVGRDGCHIAFMDYADVDETVAVVTIDGLQPGEQGYLLAGIPEANP